MSPIDVRTKYNSSVLESWDVADYGQWFPSARSDWSSAAVRGEGRGGLRLWLEKAPEGFTKEYRGAEIQSQETMITGTMVWDARVGQLPLGSVQALFAFKADTQLGRLEVDLEWTGRSGTRATNVQVHLDDPVTGQRLHSGGYLALPFDASAKFHRYEVVMTGEEAVVRADGRVLRYFSGEDFGGAWRGEQEVRAYASNFAYDNAGWSGRWNGLPDGPTALEVRAADVQPGYIPLRIYEGSSSSEKLSGNSADNILRGRDGSDWLSGGRGNDLLRGGAGDDQLYGGRGQDTLQGSDGNDWVDGGAGVDYLRGGAGADTFVFAQRSQAGDQIPDWEASDRLVINDKGFGVNLMEGLLSETMFVARGDNMAQDADDFFIFRTTDATLWFDRNGHGSGGLTFVADLQKDAVLTADNILIV